MNKLSTEDKTMIAEGAEFKAGGTYFKHIRGVLHRSMLNSKGWIKSFTSEMDYKLSSTYISFIQRTETPAQQDISSNQGDCIANKVHLVCVELQLMYSYLPATKEFLVDYDDMTFKLTTFDDIGKLRHMINLIEELSCEE